MALQATFLADFASFYDAVKKAEVQLKSFDSGVGGVEKSLNRMTDSFSGRRIITEATLMAEAVDRAGGASTLTAKELQSVGAKSAEAAEKMRLLGMEVPKNVQALSDLAANAKPAQQGTDSLTAAFTNLTASFTAAALIERAVMGLVTYGTEAVKTASRLDELSTKTGLSLDFLQRMGFVAKLSGSDLNQYTDAVYKMSLNIEKGGKETEDAVSKMGLAWAEFRKLSPEQQFLALADNIDFTSRVSERNATVTAIAGRGISDVIVGLVSGYRDLAGEAVTSSDAQLKAIKLLSDEWDKASLQMEARMGSFLGNVVLGAKAIELLPAALVTSMVTGRNAIGEFYDAYGKSLTSAKDKVDALTKTELRAVESLLANGQAVADVAKWTNVHIDAVQLLADKTSGNIKVTRDWGAELRAAELKVQSLTAAEIEKIQAAQRLGASAEQLKEEFKLESAELRILEERMRANTESKKTAEAAAKRLAEAHDELRSAGDGWRGTLEMMNQATVGALRYWLEAGVSQGALATAFGVTATQVKAVVTALTEEEKALKASEAASERKARTDAQALQQTTKLWNEYHALLVERTGTTTEIQAAAIKRWADDIEAQAVRAGTNTAEFYEALKARSTAATENLKVDWSTLRDHSRLKLDETAEKARATYEAMVARSGEFSIGTMEEFRKTAEAAELAASSWNGSFSGAIDSMSEKTAAGARKMAAEAEGVALSWERAMDLVRQGQGTMSGTVPAGFVYGGLTGGFQPIKTHWGQADGMPAIPKFSAGVENFKGGLAYVHKNELLVNMAPGTSVIPAVRATSPSGGRGGNTYNAFTINAGMGSSGAEIARLVKTALIESARDMGQRLPSGGR